MNEHAEDHRHALMDYARDILAWIDEVEEQDDAD